MRILIYFSIYFAVATSARCENSSIPLETCKLFADRLTKYADLMTDIAMLDSGFILSNATFKSFYFSKVANEIASGELDRIREAKDGLDRLCS